MYQRSGVLERFHALSALFFSVLLILLSSTLVFGQDRVELNNGDVLSGKIVERSDEQIVIETKYGGRISLDRSNVTRYELQKIRFVLKDGDVRTGRVLARGKKNVVIRTAYKNRLKIPLDQVEKEETKVEEVTVSGDAPDGKKEEPAEKSPPPLAADYWSGGLDLGYTATRGNTETNDYYARLNAKYKTKAFTNKVNGGYNYATEEDNRIKDNAFFENQLNYNLSKRTFLYNNNVIGYDNPGNLDLFFEEGVGGGYIFIDEEDVSLSVEGGPSIRFEEQSDGTNTTEALARISEDFRYKFNSRVLLNQKLVVKPSLENSGEYLGTFRAELQIKLTDALNMKFIVEDEFDSDPPAGAEENDLTGITTIGIGF